MLTRSFKTAAALGLYCSFAMAASASQSTITATVPGTPSILTQEQIKAHVKNRFYISQDIGTYHNSDPISPYHSTPLYTFMAYEHYPRPEVGYGLIATYTYNHYIFTQLRNNTVEAKTVGKVTGLMPYVNYFVSPQWLLTGQIGGYIEDLNGYSKTNTGVYNRARNQVFTPTAGAYATWLSKEEGKFSTTVRGGVYYTNQRYRSVIDSQTNFYATRHFEYAAMLLSARFKYKPDSHFWNAFLHVEADHRFFSGARPGIQKPDTGRRNMFYQVGPAVHFNLSKTWEMRIFALHIEDYDYGREERIGIRFRAAF
ncbi:MAG: hypothetical protein K2Y18_00890 [Alphaproteobacteria bacterium]|nr:hypothetical protein [Alphaproteobacteria bacterium]